MNLRADNKGLRTSLRTNAKTVLGQKKTIGDLEREMESERKDRETKKRTWKEERGNLTPRKRQRLEAPAQETAPAPEDPAYAGVFEDDNLIDIDQEYELPVPAPRPVPAAPPPIASVAAASPLPVPAAEPAAAAPAPVGLVPPFPLVPEPAPAATVPGPTWRVRGEDFQAVDGNGTLIPAISSALLASIVEKTLPWEAYRPKKDGKTPKTFPWPRASPKLR